MVKQIIVDADNTMGVPGCDTDDGLALVYLLGNPDKAQILGLTCAYGNSTMGTVYENTCRLANELEIGAPVFKGGPNPGEPISDAARFMAETVAAHPGEVSILATGSMTNLKGAALLDEHFFENVAEVVIMGGITQSLVINGRIMNELNLSCDAAAAVAVLGASCPVTVASAQACLPAVFTKREFSERLGSGSWLMQECGYWFDWMTSGYDIAAFICWDIVAAAALLEPELFSFEDLPVALNERLLTVGYLEHAAADAPQSIVRIPHIKDADEFKRSCFDAWTHARFEAGGNFVQSVPISCI